MATVIQFRAFTLDGERRQLFRDGAAVHLTPKAFDPAKRIRAASVFVTAMVPVMAAAHQFLPAPGGPPADPNIGSKSRQSAMAVLLVNLLRDRFQLATHLEHRGLPIFHLVTARTDKRLGLERS